MFTGTLSLFEMKPKTFNDSKDIELHKNKKEYDPEQFVIDDCVVEDEIQETKRVQARKAPILGFVFTSALLLIVNKQLLQIVLPCFLLLCQMSFTAIVVWLFGKCKVIQVDAMNSEKLSQFLFVPLSFMVTLFLSLKILQDTSVETFLVIRSFSTVFVAFLDVLLMDRALPCIRSSFSIMLMISGAIFYHEDKLKTMDMLWVVSWLLLFCFEQIYIKYIFSQVEMTTWGRVYYTNVIPIPLLLILVFVEGFPGLEILSLSNVLWILGSCSVACILSYCSFESRKLLTAASFTVVGHVAKLFTIVLDLLLSAIAFTLGAGTGTSAGILNLSSQWPLFVCLGGGLFYRTAPRQLPTQKTTFIALMGLLVSIAICCIVVYNMTYLYLLDMRALCAEIFPKASAGVHLDIQTYNVTEISEALEIDRPSILVVGDMDVQEDLYEYVMQPLHADFALVHDLHEQINLTSTPAFVWGIPEIMKELFQHCSEISMYREIVQAQADSKYEWFVFWSTAQAEISDYQEQDDDILRTKPRIQWNETIFEVVDLQPGIYSIPGYEDIFQIVHRDYLNNDVHDLKEVEEEVKEEVKEEMEIQKKNQTITTYAVPRRFEWK